MNEQKSRSSDPVAAAPPSRAAAWRYVLVDQGLVAIFVNFGLNWGIAWAVFHKMPSIPVAGEFSIIGDTVATCWMLPLISCLIVTSLTRNEVRQGRIAGFGADSRQSLFWKKITRFLIIRAMGWGLIGRLLLAPLAVQGIAISGMEPLPLQTFLILKGLFASALGIFFCPFHAWWALFDPVRVKLTARN